MARATFVKKARKDIPHTDIKAGDSYYWWKFRFGSKHYSKSAPRRSQLTQSEFYGQVWDIEDEIGEAPADESLASFVEDIANRLREIGEECTSRRDNMPETLQDSETGQLLQERADAMESAADEFESIDFNDAPEPDDEQTDEETQRDITEYWERKLEEVQGVYIDAP